MNSKSSGAQASVSWRISPERALHNWWNLRRAIAGARVRFLAAGYGVAGLLAFCAWTFGAPAPLGALVHFVFSLLLLGSLVFLAVEWLHARLRTSRPPLFRILPQGVSESGEDEPEVDIPWTFVRRMRIVADPDRSDYRTLEMEVLSGPEWLRDFETYRLYLPPEHAPMGEPGAPTETGVLNAIDRALAAQGIEWHVDADGSAMLRRISKRTPRP